MEFVFALALSFNMSDSQKVEAGPFLQQGHKVPVPNGGEVCMTHWWLNQCRVGDEFPAQS
ncbi:MAG: hypothetical protein ABJJ26_05445 [Algoriphagus sp.]|uniref:hypothetical protein n=1 Tax=Algoriphagus sp. TaxID=1872435 RepID=UPI0032977717